MKRPFAFFCLCLSFCLSFTINGCQPGPDQETTPADTTLQSDSTTEVVPFDAEKEKAAVLDMNRQVLQVLHNKNYQQLPPFVHPVKGVRFSLNGYVDTANDQGFSAERLTNYTTTMQDKKLVWGTNAAGKRIELTVPAYLQQQVYKNHFLSADSVGYNIIYRTATAPESMEMVYGHAPFVSNFFAGSEKQYAGLDWRSLRLVFEKYDNKYYLVGVINDQWTP